MVIKKLKNIMKNKFIAQMALLIAPYLHFSNPEIR